MKKILFLGLLLVGVVSCTPQGSSPNNPGLINQVQNSSSFQILDSNNKNSIIENFTSTSVDQNISLTLSASSLNITSISVNSPLTLSGSGACIRAYLASDSCSFNLLVPATSPTANYSVLVRSNSSIITYVVQVNQQVAGAGLSVTPTSLNFGNLNGSQSAIQQITLKNTQLSPLMGLSLSFGSTNFSIGSNSCGTQVPANGNCLIRIGFTAAGKAIQNYSDALTINATGLSAPIIIPLQAQVSAQVVVASNIVLTATPPGPFDLGTYTATQNSGLQSLVIKNTGIQSAQGLVTTVPSGYTLISSCTPTLSVNQTCFVRYSFSASGKSSGTYAGNISINSSTQTGVGLNIPITVTVNNGMAPVNCVGSFGSCSVTCGGGTQTYAITTPASNGGMACSNMAGDTQSCNPQACPPPSTNGLPVMLKDIRAGAVSSVPASFQGIPSTGQVFFTANDGVNGDNLWVTDGTASGTQVFSGMALNGSTGNTYTTLINAIGNQIFFKGQPNGGPSLLDIWVTDGTGGGTHNLTTDAHSDSNKRQYQQLSVFDFNGQAAIFIPALCNGSAGSACTYDDEIFISDGTQNGTNKIFDSSLETVGHSYTTNPLLLFKNHMYFETIDNTHGQELWSSDGTLGGTSLFKDLNPGTANGYPQYLTPLNNNTFIFVGNDGSSTSHYELWASDGTSAGTQVIAFQNGTTPQPLNFQAKSFAVSSSGIAYFTDQNGINLYRSDGTSLGTSVVKTFTSFSGITSLANGKMIFVADDGTNGPQLWVTDGTNSGTSMVFLNSNSVQYEGYPSYFISSTDVASQLYSFNGKVYFTDNDGTHNQQLWVTDGTSGGTQMLTINPTGNSNLGGFYSFNGALYFGASDGVHGVEPFVLVP